MGVCFGDYMANIWLDQQVVGLVSTWFETFRKSQVAAVQMGYEETTVL